MTTMNNNNNNNSSLFSSSPKCIFDFPSSNNELPPSDLKQIEETYYPNNKNDNDDDDNDESVMNRIQSLDYWNWPTNYDNIPFVPSFDIDNDDENDDDEEEKEVVVRKEDMVKILKSCLKRNDNSSRSSNNNNVKFSSSTDDENDDNIQYHYIETRNEYNDDEKSGTWYTKGELHTIFKNCMKYHYSNTTTINLSNDDDDEYESRGLELFSLQMKQRKIQTKKSINAVLQVQRMQKIRRTKNGNDEAIANIYINNTIWAYNLARNIGINDEKKKIN